MTRPFTGDSADINLQVERLRRKMQENIKWRLQLCHQEFRTSVRRMEENRQAAALLSAAGFEVLTDNWWGEEGERIKIDLGEGVTPKDKARVDFQKRGIARLLQCHLKESSESISDELSRRRIVRAVLTPADYPGVTIVHTTRLPKEGGKCRVVKTVRQGRRSEVSYEVVCGLDNRE